MVRDAAQDARLLTMRSTARSFPQNHLLDLAQLLLAEKHFLADKEGRRAERAALDRILRVLAPPCLDGELLRAGQQSCPAKPGCDQSFRRPLRIVHLLRLDPHVMKRAIDVSLEHALQ